MSSVQNLRGLSRRDFALMGLEGIAYIKPVVGEDGTVYEVHAADGTPIAAFGSRDVAVAAVIQNGLEPVSAH